MRNSNNTYSSRLKNFFTISESRIRKKFKILLKGFFIGEKVAYKI